MFHPPAYYAKTLEFTDEVLDDPTQKCLCDKPCKLRDVMVVYTHKTGETDPHWFAFCNAACFTGHLTGGSA